MRRVQEQVDARSRFRREALSGTAPSLWCTRTKQNATLDMLLDRIANVRARGRRAVLGLDLDLTTLLAPARSAEVLLELAPRTTELAAEFGHLGANAARLEAAVERVWKGAPGFILPGYTTTAIEGYGVYLAAALIAAENLALSDDDRDRLESWVNRTVHALLRNGYWARDLLRDLISPGVETFIAKLYAAGGEVAFLSNRPRETRNASLTLCRQMVGAAELFAWFGPGGSAFDAASKVEAVTLIESGTPAAIYLAEIVDGRLVYAPSAASGSEGAVIIGIADDRAENRREVARAATQSTAFWQSLGLSGIAEVAVAAPGFSTEIEIVDAPARISSFES